jgi:hypothetical protein
MAERFNRNGRAPYGAGTLMACGYRRMRVAGDRKELEHRLVAERALGRALPAKAMVHHVDGDRANNAPGNLVICPSQAYHSLLHQRQDALDACGHPGWLKCFICGEYGPPEEVRAARGGNNHPACYSRRNAHYKAARKAQGATL